MLLILQKKKEKNVSYSNPGRLGTRKTCSHNEYIDESTFVIESSFNAQSSESHSENNQTVSISDQLRVVESLKYNVRCRESSLSLLGALFVRRIRESHSPRLIFHGNVFDRPPTKVERVGKRKGAGYVRTVEKELWRGWLRDRYIDWTFAQIFKRYYRWSAYSYTIRRTRSLYSLSLSPSLSVSSCLEYLKLLNCPIIACFPWFAYICNNHALHHPYPFTARRWHFEPPDYSAFGLRINTSGGNRALCETTNKYRDKFQNEFHLLHSLHRLRIENSEMDD